MKKPNILVFDVESTSLYGQAFAVGAVVLDGDGKEIDSFQLMDERMSHNSCKWVRDNVLPKLAGLLRGSDILQLRDSFYQFYCRHRDTADVWCDCGFPVETAFLKDVVLNDHNRREFEMPYPLKDISTIIDIGIDRAVASGISGLRQHHPLDDARASARVLFNYLKERR